MEKALRSLIHEKFDLDTRVAIELLSRRRDIQNKEKQDELIKIFKDKIEGTIVKLGPGTNRYAVKLDGFVVKIATDHDGKIDNFKEFKMGKRLYPYVPQIHEVAENGTLLITEYIQPFESYADMYRYADKIRAILKKLSSTYLIGDVGITPKNSSNWGLRVGTDDPVCLDFAYVYEISTKLFLCTFCKTGAMLVPNDDYTELYCSNKSCRRRYTFEDIRTKIGNDVHAHEIGDLSEEGYRIFDSHVVTELTESRSNYLIKKREEAEAKLIKKKPTKQPEEKKFIDNFVMDAPPPRFYEEEPTMSSNLDRIMKNAQENSGHVVIQATAIPLTPGIIIPGSVVSTPAPIIPEPAEDEMDESMEIIGDPQVLQEPKPDPIDETDESGVAFVSDEDDEPQKPIKATATLITADEEDKNKRTFPKSVLAAAVRNINEAVKEMNEKETEIPRVQAEIVRNPEPVVQRLIPEPEPEPKPAPQPAPRPAPKVDPNRPYFFNSSFMHKMKDAVSRVTNRIKDSLRDDDLYGVIKATRGIKDNKMFADMFYKNIQNAAFRTLVSFCGFTEEERPRSDGAGVYRVFDPPKDLHGPYEPTLRFLERVWCDPKTAQIWNENNFMEEYRKIYDDFQGIQEEWIPLFEKRLSSKMAIDKIAAKKIVDIVKENWCAPPKSEPKVEEKRDEWTEEELNAYITRAFELNGLPTMDKPMNEEDQKLVIRYIIGIKSKELTGEEANQDDPEDIDLIVCHVKIGDEIFHVYYNIDLIKKMSIILVSSNIQEIHGKVVDSEHYESLDDLLNNILIFDKEKFIKFSEEIVQELYQNYIGEEDEEDEEDDDDEDVDYEEDELIYLSVDIRYLDDYDIIKIHSAEAAGDISIPIYAKLDDVALDAESPSIVDDRNGVWDWLMHMPPDLLFVTSDPEKFMKLNEVDEHENIPRSVILDKRDDGTYLMGIYYVAGYYILDAEGNERPCYDETLRRRLNKLIKDQIGFSGVSHLKRTMTMEDIIVPEEYVDNHIMNFSQAITDDEDEEEEDDDGEDVRVPNFYGLNDAEKAALAVMTYGSKILPPDAPVEQKEYADFLKKMSYQGFGLPVPEEEASEEGVARPPVQVLLDHGLNKAREVQRSQLGTVDVVRRRKDDK